MAAMPSGSFGDLLRLYRLAAGLTQEELAERANLSARAISDLERGARSRPWRDTVQLLVNALRLSEPDRVQLEEAARRATAPGRQPSADYDHAGELAHPHNLPVQLTSFVGRDREVADVKARLADARLLTLAGPGGCGKTRLALQVATDVLATYSDGVWFVDLAPLGEPALIPEGIANVLGIQNGSGQPTLDILTAYLHRRQALLILDNCEHLIDACARFAETLIRACPQLRILATSREPLGIPGEVPWRVPPLAVPDLPAATNSESRILQAVNQSEAGQLFVERAAVAEPRFALTLENARAVAEVCRRLDGIPLAIELAAARTTVLSVEEIAARLDQRFRLLTGGSRTALRRQQTLQAAIDWSYDLLAEDERVVLRRLAVFAGSFSLAAAEAVCSPDVLEVLGRLVAKSLVQVEAAGGETRYRLLETIRQYATEKLLTAGEATLARDRHFTWYLHLAERAEPELFGRNEDTWFDRLDREYPNIAAALEWGRSADIERVLRLVGSLFQYWFARDFGEGVRLVESTLAAAPVNAPGRAKVLVSQGVYLRGVFGGMARARAVSEQALALARSAGDRHLTGLAFHNLGCIATALGEVATARSALRESIEIFTALGDDAWAGASYRDLAILALAEGDYSAASDLHDRSLRLLRPLGGKRNLGWTLLSIGRMSRRLGDAERAREMFTEYLSLARARDSRAGTAWALVELANLDRENGDLDQAEARLRESLPNLLKSGVWTLAGYALWCLATVQLQRGDLRQGVVVAGAAAQDRLIRVYTSPTDEEAHAAALAAARLALGGDAFEQAWVEGRAMSLEDAVAYAME
jgi:non-specific serine/threonine protein kinase